jgi:hypothetical protein
MSKQNYLKIMMIFRAMENGNNVHSTIYVKITLISTKTYLDTMRKTLNILITGYKNSICCANQQSISVSLAPATWLACSSVSLFYHHIQTLTEEGLFSYLQ